MIQIAQIQERKIKSGKNIGNPYDCIIDNNGNQFPLFGQHDLVLKCKIGWHVNIEKDDRGNNLLVLASTEELAEAVNEAELEPVKAKTQPEGDVPKPPNRQIAVTTPSDKDKLILRQVAFKGAIEYAVHGLIGVEDVEIWADRFNEYLSK